MYLSKVCYRKFIAISYYFIIGQKLIILKIIIAWNKKFLAYIEYN